MFFFLKKLYYYFYRNQNVVKLQNTNFNLSFFFCELNNTVVAIPDDLHYNNIDYEKIISTTSIVEFILVLNIYFKLKH